MDALALAPVEFGAALDAWRVGDDAKKPGNEGPQLIRASVATGQMNR
jgi:hypothetical protein